ncbi:protein polyglycylase TTLL10 [Parambassis ranga]|uniref:Protein polyglycylase TTLL10 n=1 Tax=Parambassis ranga TaxID=210632 RepID=A0A6P7IUZ0_9TELE|nr:inactive polyglycylase TTLL10 [Parambassis ranga]
MSSECSGNQAEGTGLKKQQEKEYKKEETDVPCGDSRPAGKPGQEEPRTDQPLSPDCSCIQEVTSEGGQEQVQTEETHTQEGRKRLSGSSVNQKSQRERSASGACVVERHLQRSKSRGMSTSSNTGRERERPVEEPRGPGPFYFFGGTNGAEIVANYCESRGWRRIYNNHREDFKLKWCETKSPADYSNFREGEQLLFQIPNNKLLTTKIGLLSSLRDYERVSSKARLGQGLRRLKMEEFIPTTFRMDVREEKDAFFSQQDVFLGVSNKESPMWICKPTGLNQGRGIFLLKSQEDIAAFRLKLQHMEANRKMHQCEPQAHVVQHYIQRPLLLTGKKFDVRSYLLIACTAPYMVFFRHGYVRLTCDLYDPRSNNLSAHLTNQYMQKKNPLYSQLKEDTVWSMESFNAYVNDRFQVAKGLPRDWVLGAFAKRMQQIMMQCFFAVKSKLHCRLGFFDLIGCDFMVDEDFKVWLLEMNCNPALHTNCKVLKEVVPRTVEETLDLTLEIFNKCRLRQQIFPLVSQREFVLLFNSDVTSNSVLANSKSNTNTEKHQKTCKMMLKTEPTRVNSAGKVGSVDVLARGKESTPSPLHRSVTKVQVGSHLQSMQTVRSKNSRPRVELKLSKCTFLKATEDMKLPQTQQKMRIIMSLSSRTLTQHEMALPACGPPVCTDGAVEEGELKQEEESKEKL